MTTAWTVCVVCLRKYFLPACNGRWCIQQTRAVQFRLATRQIFQAHDHVAAADVNVVLQAKGDGLRAERLGHRAAVGPDVLDGGFDAQGQHDDLLALAHDAAGNHAAQAAKIMQRFVGGVVGPVHPLHGKAEGGEVPVAGDVHGFQMPEQRSGLHTTGFWGRRPPRCRR